MPPTPLIRDALKQSRDLITALWETLCAIPGARITGGDRALVADTQEVISVALKGR
jgi:hypothetical protein